MEPTALHPTEVADLLRATASAVRAELAVLPASAWNWHPAPGEWCVLEVLGHLIEAERRGFAGRIRIILDGDAPQLEAWDQAQVAGERRDCERDPVEMLTEFARLRETSVALVAGLKGSDLQRAGHHPEVGVLRVGDLLHEWVHHDRNHLKQILANVQAFVWPHMGNAQRFTKEDAMTVKITARPNGPYVVEGECEVYDAKGAKVDTTGKPKIALCRCGGSATKPFCDGTHSKIGFQSS